jgi:hypothetical protein
MTEIAIVLLRASRFFESVVLFVLNPWVRYFLPTLFVVVLPTEHPPSTTTIVRDLRSSNRQRSKFSTAISFQRLHLQSRQHSDPEMYPKLFFIRSLSMLHSLYQVGFYPILRLLFILSCRGPFVNIHTSIHR